MKKTSDAVMTVDAGELAFGALGARIAAGGEAIDAAADVAALAAAAQQVRALGVALAAGEAGAALVTRVVAALNDRLTVRAIRLAAARHRLPAAAWAWIALGSEGRGEQTFATDQDNCLIFSAADAGEAHQLRRLFQPFARTVNESLAACGFPLCAGDIMAGNPQWCLSLDEWRALFFGWIRSPDPKALLNATIFFDLRTLHGEAALAAALQKYLLRLTAANEVFARMMTDNALAVAPPLGLLRGFVGKEGPDGGIDLKKLGARLFVDAARIFALAAGMAPVNTAARLRAAAAARLLSAADAEAAVQAFDQIQRLRLAAQAGAIGNGLAPGNGVNPDRLNGFDRSILREALKQARRLQLKLQLSFAPDR